MVDFVNPLRRWAGSRSPQMWPMALTHADEAELRHHVFRRFYGRDFANSEQERILAYLTKRR